MWIVMLARSPTPTGVAFRDPNDCLYQFVSIVFEYFSSVRYDFNPLWSAGSMLFV